MYAGKHEVITTSMSQVEQSLIADVLSRALSEGFGMSQAERQCVAEYLGTLEVVGPTDPAEFINRKTYRK